MTRILKCTIENKGDGDIELIDDHLSHGEWIESRSPTEAASLIKPGEVKGFHAEDGGDIPIIGNIATGCQGWVLYRCYVSEFVGMPSPCFVRIYWNMPFLDFTPGGDDGVGVNAFRYDPRVVIGQGQFDDRDKSPPPLQLNISYGVPTPTGDFISGLWPWMCWLPTWPLVLAESKFGADFKLTFLTTSKPEVNTLPLMQFGTNKASTPTAEAMISTNASMWAGTWRSEHVVARIVPVGENHLEVSVTETVKGTTLELDTQRVGISRLVYKYAEGSIASLLGIEEPISALKHLKLYEVSSTNSPRMSAKLIERAGKSFQRIVHNNPQIIANVLSQHHQIGGDFIRLDPDATLEILRLVADGQVVGVELRYRRPATMPLALPPVRLVEILKYELQLH